MTGIKQKIIVISLIIVNISLIGFLGFRYIGQDSKKPKLEFSAVEVIYSEDMDIDELKQGVTARDDKDGDISNRIVVEKVTINYEKKAAVAYFAVSDSSGNVTKASKMFPIDENTDISHLVGEISEINDVEKDSISANDSDSDEIVEDDMSANSVDGDEDVSEEEETGADSDDNSQISSTPSPLQKSSPSPASTPTPTPKPTPTPQRERDDNRDADNEADNENETNENVGSRKPTFTVKNQMIIAKSGKKLTAKEVISSAEDDVDSESDLIKHASITDYPIDEPGIYTVYVSTTDSDGNVATPIPIIVKVE